MDTPPALSSPRSGPSTPSTLLPDAPAKLTAGMEHIRAIVSVDQSLPLTSSPNTSNDAYGVPASYQPLRKPVSYSADKHLKRTDPFQFGARYLEEGDDIFAHNAWDHVETDEAYREFTEMQYARQREAPVAEKDRERYLAKPDHFWNVFYKKNSERFFKNRKWLTIEFPILSEVTREDAQRCTLLEVGAGAGNTAFPILALNKNPGLRIHACDFSKTAVDVMRKNEAYDTNFMQADVWDVASETETLPPGLEKESVDIVLMIFIFSALEPRQWRQALRNIWDVLKPGGTVLFRDYGRGDLAQVRFKKGRYLEENFYARGDGTRVYFFEQEELERIWSGKAAQSTAETNTTAGEKDGASESTPDELNVSGLSLDENTKKDYQEQEQRSGAWQDVPKFEVVNFGVDRRMLVNRQRRLKMYRCWMQARLRKPIEPLDT